MASSADQALVSELLGRDEQRPGQRSQSAPDQQRPQSPSRLGLSVVLWSCLANVVLLACFLAGWNFDQIRSYLPTDRLTTRAASQANGTVNVSRQQLQDNELLTLGPQRQLKGPLQFTLVPSTVPESSAEAQGEIAADEPSMAASADAPVAPDQSDSSAEITVGPEDPAAQLTRSPVLRRAAKAGDIEIGNFSTVSFAGSGSECLDAAYNLLEDAGAPRDKLKLIAETSMITIARVCATNGTVVVTCRGGQITISPRKPKFNETCTG